MGYFRFRNYKGVDYVAPNLAEPGTKQQGPFINAHLGPYDVWAIACGYGPKDALAAELAKSSQPEHTYVSQAAISFGPLPSLGFCGAPGGFSAGGATFGGCAWCERRMD